MAKLTLDELFRDRVPSRTPEQRHSWLTAGDCRFIIWGFKERWPAARIAGVLGVNEATVRRFRKRYWDDPQLLLELDLYEMVGRARDEEYRCLVCEEKVIYVREIQRHVLCHFLDMSLVDNYLPKSRKRKDKSTR